MTSLAQKVKILIVDDHLMSRQGMKDMLREQNQIDPIISEAENGAEAINLISKEPFDLVLLDLEMPKMDGFSTLSALRENGNETAIIIFSFHSEELLIQRILDEGANGYISKGVNVEGLVIGITRVLNGETYFEGIDQHRASFDSELDKELTKRELQVLKLIAEESTNLEIAESLCISVRTVEGHKKNLTDKLNVKGSVGLTKYALKYGIAKNA
jgi:DNA-binding NarL/FixJ family response regulator